MRRPTRVIAPVASAAAIVLAVAGARASGAGVSSPVAASCLIEKVVLQPAEKPQTAQITGACAVATSANLYEPYGAARDGRIRAGSTILSCGMGAGLVWGAALVRW